MVYCTKVPIHARVRLGSGSNESNSSVCGVSRAGRRPIIYIYPSLAPESSSPRRTREPDSYVYGHLKGKKVLGMELNFLAVDLGRCNPLVNWAVNLWVSLRKAANFLPLKRLSASEGGRPWNFGCQQFHYANM
jgi:hypothetical protein